MEIIMFDKDTLIAFSKQQDDIENWLYEFVFAWSKARRKANEEAGLPVRSSYSFDHNKEYYEDFTVNETSILIETSISYQGDSDVFHWAFTHEELAEQDLGAMLTKKAKELAALSIEAGQQAAKEILDSKY